MIRLGQQMWDPFEKIAIVTVSALYLADRKDMKTLFSSLIPRLGVYSGEIPSKLSWLNSDFVQFCTDL